MLNIVKIRIINRHSLLLTNMGPLPEIKGTDMLLTFLDMAHFLPRKINCLILLFAQTDAAWHAQHGFARAGIFVRRVFSRFPPRVSSGIFS